MATPAEIRTAVNAKLTTVLGHIQTRQTAFHAAQGRFWQGLRSHSATPEDGAETLPDVGLRTPSDISQSWPAAVRSSVLPMSVECHVYDGPAGTGYAVIAAVQIAGRRWTRTVNVGPEGHRDQGWTEQDGL